jgi:alpha-ribazole phosphatase
VTSSGLWVVRHAAPLIAPGTCYGALDVAADPQATLLAAQRLAQALPARATVRHSPLQRCEQLAQALQALRADLTSQPDARLGEMDFGQWEGRLWADIARIDIDAWTQNFAHYRPGEGESLHAMLTRVEAARREAWGAIAQGSAVVWITHAGVARCVAWLCSHGNTAPLSHRWPVAAPGWGEWVVCQPGSAPEALTQQA